MIGNFNVSDGGRVTVVDGMTGERLPLKERNYREPLHRQHDRERTERARNFYPNPRERSLERELYSQVSGETFSADETIINPRLDIEFEQWTNAIMGNQDTIEKLNSELFNQVAAAYAPPAE